MDVSAFTVEYAELRFNNVGITLVHGCSTDPILHNIWNKNKVLKSYGWSTFRKQLRREKDI